VRLAQGIQIVDTLVLNHKLDEQVRDAPRLPLRLLVPVAVLGVQLDDVFCKPREIRHRNGLRYWRGLGRWWIATAILAVGFNR
jgi:hypothetical protein